MASLSVEKAGGVRTGSLLIACVTEHGSATHPYYGSESLLAGHEGGVFNLGTGEGHSVLAVLKAIERVTGETLGTPLGERRPGDPPILIADPTLSMRELQFRPAHSSLEEIIRSSWDWHQRAHPRRAT